MCIDSPELAGHSRQNIIYFNSATKCETDKSWFPPITFLQIQRLDLKTP